MRRSAVGLLAAGLSWLTAPAYTQMRASDQPEMQAAQFLLGTWSCKHTVGDFAGTYTTIYESSLGDLWLKQTYDFPATSDQPAVHAEYFLEYDPRSPVQHWVRFGAHSNGQYYGMVGKRAGNVWSWSYVLPGPSGSVVWTKRSDSEYAIDGPSYSQNGKQVTEHHTCRKAS